MKQRLLSFRSALTSIAVLFFVSSALAQTAPPLGVLDRFGILGGSAVTGSTTAGSTVNGDVGSSPTASISNFPPTLVTPPFILHLTNDLVVQQARADAGIAFNDLDAQSTVGPTTAITGDTLGGLVLTPGIYTCGACLLATTETLTLNDPSGTGIFIFDVDSSLTMDVDSLVTGTANPCNVYWRVGTSATINGDDFYGTVLAGVSITVGSGANLQGRAIAGTGAVTMAGGGARTIGGCASIIPPVCPTITVNPTSLPSGVLGVPYNQTVTASGGDGTYVFTVTSGELPDGLVLSPTGSITGTPATAENATFTITAVETSSGCSGSREYFVVIGSGATGIPALDYAGLAILMALLAGTGLFVMRRL